jgi:hypothetical protein
MDGELILRAFAMVAWQVGPSIDVAQTDIVPQPVQNPQLTRTMPLTYESFTFTPLLFAIAPPTLLSLNYFSPQIRAPRD